jgi:hypothetical protein
MPDTPEEAAGSEADLQSRFPTAYTVEEMDHLHPSRDTDE